MSLNKPAHAAADLLTYIDGSPSPFHCVAETAARLQGVGFTELSEAETWQAAPGSAHYTIRGGGSLVAWRTGQTSPVNSGFRVIGAHTDSPNLRLKPKLAKASHGYLQLDIETYGGLVQATWADRDLGLAGRIFIEAGDQLEPRLLRIHRPLGRVSNVAIHLNRKVNDEGLVLNRHQHLAPIIGLWSPEADPESTPDPTDRVLALVAKEAGVDPGAIIGHDLCLYDLQSGALSGLDDEFIHCSRLDNQAMCHAALSSLIAAQGSTPHTSVIALFDHEEIGSTSARGAASSLLSDVLTRLSGDAPQAAQRSAARSFVVSADMAHAIHPNFGDLHDGAHLPRLNAGPVIKTNVNQRYATDAESGALFRRLCRKADVPYQEFVNRADLACGSSVGPITASGVGIRTVDVGNPMLSMHSCREMAGSRDHALMIRTMTEFLSEP